MSAADEELAKKRFAVLSLTRLSGALMVALGLGIVSNGLFGLPKAAGYFVLVAGIIGFILMPLFLAKAWKSPPVP